jgi:hypothetical protein
MLVSYASISSVYGRSQVKLTVSDQFFLCELKAFSNK